MILTRVTFLALALLCGVSLQPGPASAGDIVTDVAPPPPRTENAGHSRDGYVWAPGHWDWTGHAYHWLAGSWIVGHGQARWVADRWESEGTQWRFIPGHWEH